MKYNHIKMKNLCKVEGASFLPFISVDLKSEDYHTAYRQAVLFPLVLELMKVL